MIEATLFKPVTRNKKEYYHIEYRYRSSTVCDNFNPVFCLNLKFQDSYEVQKENSVFVL